MSNRNLFQAKNAKNDEFYTQYNDISCELTEYVNYNRDLFRDKTILLPCDDYRFSNFTKYFIENFEKYGIRKLISTCYNNNSRGTMFVLERNNTSITDLCGNGDFRSDEICGLRSEADFIITNPPFSLYRDFINWIFVEEKQFLVVGNKNSITYKEIFPLIMQNKIWSGVSKWSGGMWFYTKNDFLELSNVASTWFTNIEHGRRHEFLKLNTMEENVKYGAHKTLRQYGYQHYDNYNAIEVPYSDAIPSDYHGPMGVPITFLEKYNPDQFQIIGASESEGKGFSNGLWDETSNVSQPMINGKRVYKRFFIVSK